MQDSSTSGKKPIKEVEELRARKPKLERVSHYVTKDKKAGDILKGFGVGIEQARRKTGIDIIGDIAWGGHFCVFYQSKQDLIDILVPYFKAGLENNEFCMWITSKPLSAKDAEQSLRQAVKNLDDCIKRGQIEILDYCQWYTKWGKFDADKVLQGWVEKHDQAVKRGFDGLRLSGNIFWLEEKDWRKFTEYERTINSVLGQYRMLAVCTYSLHKCGVSEVIDVVGNHQFTVIKQEGKWVLVESAERKKAEEAYRALVDHSLQGLLILQDGRAVFANQAMAEISGYTVEEMLAMSPEQVQAFVHPDDRELVWSQHRGRLNGEAVPECYEFRGIRKDGSTCWLELHASRIEYQGKPAIQAAYVDVTERKKAEQALRENEKRYRSLFENMLDGFAYCKIIVDEKNKPIDFVYLEVNDAFERLTGLKRKDVIRKKVTEAIPGIKEAHPELFDIYGKAALTGKEDKFDIHFKPLDIWLSISVYSPQKGYFVAVFENITERKQAEEALRRSQKDWENTFNAISDWVVLMNLKGRILRTNHAGEEFVGVPLAGMVGQTCCKLLHGSDTPLPGCPLLKMLQSGRSETMELQLPDSNRWLAITVDPVIDEKGTLAGAVHIARDITERRHAEDERESTIKLLHLINTNNQMHELMKVTMVFLKDWSDCEAIGIRFQEGEDFPYFETSGFPKDFILAENKLCSVDEAGELVRDSQGRPYLECMCGSVISGRFDPSKPFFTEHGSFWTNSTTELLAGTTEADRLARTCNRCNTAGYESVALVPLRVGGDTFGLLQFNDKQKGRFTPKKISLFERLADNLAIGLAQRRAEEALRQSEELLELFFSQSLDGFFFMMLDEPVRWDDTVDKEEKLDYVFAHQRVTKVNDAMLLQYGASREQFMGMTPNDLYAHNIAYGRDVWRDFFDAGRLHIETDERKLDGTPMWIEGDYICLYDSQGRITGHFGIQRDITERKEAEETLKNSEQKYKGLIETAIDGYVMTNMQGKILDCNKAFLDMIGYTMEEAKKLSYQDITPQKWHKMEEEIIKSQFIKRGYSNVYEKEYIRKDGTVFPISIRGRLIKDEKGQAIGLWGFVGDITERKKAEEAYRALVDHSLQGLAIFQDGRAVFANQAMAEITGYTVDEMLAMSSQQIQAFVHPDDRTLVWGRHQDRLKGKHPPERYEFRGIRKDGTICWLEIHASRIEYQGKPAIQAAYVDITERKRVEQRLLEDQVRLKSLASQLTLTEERERRRIASELHDRIGQSLVISKMNLEALRKSEYGEKTDETLDEICNSLAQTIADTRTLTFDLSSPILYELGFEAAVAEWLTGQIRDKHGIKTEFEDDRRPKPLDDDIRVLLFRDVRELLINVVRHANAQNVKVSIRKVDEQIHVSVEDDGVGFNPAEAISMAVETNGFGLFSIQERLEQIGGHLEIESGPGPGRGCKITMTAPLKQG